MKKPRSERAKYAARTFLLKTVEDKERFITVIRNAPLDPLRPLQGLLREEVKARKPDQNALLFAGPIRDIAEQAWFDGRQFDAEVIHHFCKKSFLPDAFDPELTLEGYVKWTSDPLGDPVMVGSTKMLTVFGFSNYLEQVFAFGASLGVEFTKVPPKDF